MPLYEERERRRERREGGKEGGREGGREGGEGGIVIGKYMSKKHITILLCPLKYNG